jgi:hypothetical protein
MDQWTDRSSDEDTGGGSDPEAPLPEESGSAPTAGSDEDTATGTDASGPESPAFEPPASGDDNIREGRVGGVMGGPNQQQGQGQGG